MNLSAGSFTAAWLTSANLACLGLIAAAVKFGAWRLLAANGREHVYAGATLACMLLWTISGSVETGMSFHLLGTTVLTLMFGAPLAFVASLIALAGISIAGLAGWQAFGLNAMLMGALPIAVSHGVDRFADTRLPNHFFVYVFVSAFLNGMLAMAVSRVTTLGLLWLDGAAIGSHRAGDYLLATVLLAWGEGLLTGMLTTILIVYRPTWVATFDDARYVMRR